ncbi:GNAT family N-acetyltransferase [Actinopolymorpha rutila]|uniref:Ribosomal protein S18 acetylase RimI-like enzyme n=1 Tax=Actinopolymorpha rutila TaxID=446787 RepID=A0A852ZTM6_9ACTN|nr:GNAT family N-acetyltransferase [Actinopolymorpha rutila]NYH92350.1 ribosomal protein S18 acetylase RimI-like enzyme [Actinopolymorpha rutila]
MTSRNSLRCEECSVLVEGPNLEDFSDAYLAHARSQHPEWPFPDLAVRNFAEATQRLTGATERLETIGTVTIHPVGSSRIPDWLTFFDHDAFAGNPVDAVCYCSGPHLLGRGQTGGELRPWRQNRQLMVDLLSSGRAFGYLAYVDGTPAGWVNASKRAECSMYRTGDAADPPDSDVISLSCFGIAPPYRGHGLVSSLLRRVLADAAGRGTAWVESYPFNDQTNVDEDNWRGPRSLYDAFGFEQVEKRESYSVLRRRVDDQ